MAINGDILTLAVFIGASILMGGGLLYLLKDDQDSME